MVLLVLAVGIGLLIFAFIGRLIGQTRGQAGTGAFMGALLGPVGLVGAAFLPDKRRQCPACKGHVPDDARKCMHCGDDLPDLPTGFIFVPVAPAKATPKTESTDNEREKP